MVSGGPISLQPMLQEVGIPREGSVVFFIMIIIVIIIIVVIVCKSLFHSHILYPAHLSKSPLPIKAHR